MIEMHLYEAYFMADHCYYENSIRVIKCWQFFIEFKV